jgi:hypothetical protein
MSSLVALEPSFFETLLADYPAGLALFHDLQRFYGTSLRLTGGETQKGTSTYRIDAGQSSPVFREASITLNTTGNRVPAAAIHEMLHLRQPLKGFPLARTLELSVYQQGAASDIENTLTRTTNVVDHDIFAHDFIAMGFPIESFLMQGRLQFDVYKNQSKKLIKRRHSIDDAFMWTFYNWWSLEYLRHFISIEHGTLKSQQLATNVELWGVRALPDFGDIAHRIRRWVSIGRHRGAKSYQSALDELLALMRMPPISSFSLLSSSGDGGPPAVTVVSK